MSSRDGINLLRVKFGYLDDIAVHPTRHASLDAFSTQCWIHFPTGAAFFGIFYLIPPGNRPQAGQPQSFVFYEGIAKIDTASLDAHTG